MPFRSRGKKQVLITPACLPAAQGSRPLYHGFTTLPRRSLYRPGDRRDVFQGNLVICPDLACALIIRNVTDSGRSGWPQGLSARTRESPPAELLCGRDTRNCVA